MHGDNRFEPSGPMDDGHLDVRILFNSLDEIEDGENSSFETGDLRVEETPMLNGVRYRQELIRFCEAWRMLYRAFLRI